ncbi:hypothetical protein GCM10009784_20160 [Arthrobacter parietis]|uniref:Uncharacterized protein n=1 Tax=Arthrobacter parietis TaxID=271434 RepID=A0ABP5MMN5_9MICC
MVPASVSCCPNFYRVLPGSWNGLRFCDRLRAIQVEDTVQPVRAGHALPRCPAVPCHGISVGTYALPSGPAGRYVYNPPAAEPVWSAGSDALRQERVGQRHRKDTETGVRSQDGR